MENNEMNVMENPIQEEELDSVAIEQSDEEGLMTYDSEEESDGQISVGGIVGAAGGLIGLGVAGYFGVKKLLKSDKVQAKIEDVKEHRAMIRQKKETIKTIRAEEKEKIKTAKDESKNAIKALSERATPAENVETSEETSKKKK